MTRLAFRSVTYAALLASLLRASSHAQSRSPVRAHIGTQATLATLPIPRDVASAEREGATFPRGGPPDSLRAQRMMRGTGTAERTCVKAASTPPTRAGDFTVNVGAFGFAAGRPNKMYWTPLHDPSFGGNGLLVRGARIDAKATPADTARYVNLEYVWPLTADKKVDPAGAGFIGFTMPTAGTWLLVATSGADWACLIAEGVIR